MNPAHRVMVAARIRVNWLIKLNENSTVSEARLMSFITENYVSYALAKSTRYVVGFPHLQNSKFSQYDLLSRNTQWSLRFASFASDWRKKKEPRTNKKTQTRTQHRKKKKTIAAWFNWHGPLSWEFKRTDFTSQRELGQKNICAWIWVNKLTSKCRRTSCGATLENQEKHYLFSCPVRNDDESKTHLQVTISSTAITI